VFSIAFTAHDEQQRRTGKSSVVIKRIARYDW
jgi:hypothetical protein